MTENSANAGLAWLAFSMISVFSWGMYGNTLHAGQSAMDDPINGRYKAFLFVGLAYCIVAVAATWLLLWARGASFEFPAKGMGISLVAGVFGCFGALGVLLAFGAKGTPPVVMTIVFAGAPIINAIVSILLHPPAGGLNAIRPQFVLGILLAATGAGLVTLYKPAPGGAKEKSPTVEARSAGTAGHGTIRESEAE